MRNARSRRFVDQAACPETFKAEIAVQRMRLTVCQRMREHAARTRRRLESASPPSAVNVEIFDRRLADDRARVRRAVDDACPLAHHAQAAKQWKQFQQRPQLLFNQVET